MRKVSCKKIIEAVSGLVQKTAYTLPDDVKKHIHAAHRKEKEPLGKKYLGIIIENIAAAEKEPLPLCQDTGLAIFFVHIGCGVSVDTGIFGSIEEIINSGLAEGSKKGHLRNSVVSAIDRKNTGTNTPGIVHLVTGQKDEFKIALLIKGFGSENTSAVKMLSPTAGREGIEEFITDTVAKAGSLPCPPVFLGVGVGGSFEKAAILSKQALCRIGEKSSQRKWEKSILQKLNLGVKIGPGGFGGNTTVMDMRIETFPTHIAGLPVAVNISCWAHRFGTVNL